MRRLIFYASTINNFKLVAEVLFNKGVRNRFGIFLKKAKVNVLFVFQNSSCFIHTNKIFMLNRFFFIF